jgi:hypothetical protein
MLPAVFLAALLAAVAADPLPAIGRDARKETRRQYEGRTLRLRIDLKPDTSARAPNVVSLAGIGYTRERDPVLFSRLERVFLERVSDEGATRLVLTLYRSEDEANRLRASAIPQPILVNPNAGRTLAAFARQGSTTVLLELKAPKSDSTAQLGEIETLLDRLFYLSADPTDRELRDFVRQHPGLPLPRLRALTGLEPEVIRALIAEAVAPPPPPPVDPPSAPPADAVTPPG